MCTAADSGFGVRGFRRALHHGASIWPFRAIVASFDTNFCGPLTGETLQLTGQSARALARGRTPP